MAKVEYRLVDPLVPVAVVLRCGPDDKALQVLSIPLGSGLSGDRIVAVVHPEAGDSPTHFYATVREVEREMFRLYGHAGHLPSAAGV